jgi:putative hydrolase of the HAD superfamily
MKAQRGALLFDWGDTLMADFKQYTGPMKDWPEVAALPGAQAVLAALQPDWHLILATSADVSTAADIHAALRRVDLDGFIERIYSFKDLQIKKTDPAFYRRILGDLGLPPEKVCMIGDHYEADVLSPTAAGLRAVWLERSGAEDRRSERIRTIHALDELPAVLAAWEI